MSTGKAQTEIACTFSWISNWSIDQKHHFSNNLANNIREQSQDDTSSLESLSNLLNNIKLDPNNKDSPSVFECQIRIFNKWYSSWDLKAKEEFFNRMKVQCPELYDNFL